MPVPITPEQKAELLNHGGGPIPLSDADGEIAGFLISAKGSKASTEAIDNELMQLVQAGVDAESIPAEAAHAWIRQRAQEYAQRESAEDTSMTGKDPNHESTEHWIELFHKWTRCPRPPMTFVDDSRESIYD